MDPETWNVPYHDGLVALKTQDHNVDQYLFSTQALGESEVSGSKKKVLDRRTSRSDSRDSFTTIPMSLFLGVNTINTVNKLAGTIFRLLIAAIIV